MSWWHGEGDGGGDGGDGGGVDGGGGGGHVVTHSCGKYVGSSGPAQAGPPSKNSPHHVQAGAVLAVQV